MKLVYPFAVTFLFIFCGLIFATIRLLSGKSRFLHWQVFLMLAWYYGILHIPFVIQARYTIPAHLAILVMLSLTLFSNRTSSRETGT